MKDFETSRFIETISLLDCKAYNGTAQMFSNIKINVSAEWQLRYCNNKIENYKLKK